MSWLIPANKPYFPSEDSEKITSEIHEILKSGILTDGPWIDKFEKSFAEYIGCDYAIATNCGTSALEILLRYYNIRGKEIIVPTNSFVASANAVIFAGGTPILSDISPTTLCINPQQIQKKITNKTMGVIAVHIAGLVCPEIDEMKKLCEQNNLFLIEDAAHAVGAQHNSKKAGNLCDGGAFSFYPTKVLTCGEGGMITTHNKELAHFAKSLRCHGIGIHPQTGKKLNNRFTQLGHNWRMSEMQAVVGFYQLKRLEDAIAQRNSVASQYNRFLNELEELELIETPPNDRNSYYKYPVILNTPHSRENIVNQLKENYGIQCGSIYWPPIHLQPFYQDQFGYKDGDFKNAEDVLTRTISLPIYPELTSTQIDQVVNALKTVLKTNVQESILME